MRTVSTLVLVAVLAAIACPADAGTVTFRFRAPDGAKTVTVAGTFNDWNSMVAPLGDGDADGIWETAFNIRGHSPVQVRGQ